MATQFRLSTLPKEDLAQLQGLSNDVPGILDYVEKNGKLPPEAESFINSAYGGSASAVKNRLNGIISKLPSKQDALGKVISAIPTDLSTATDSELQTYLDAYNQSLGGSTQVNSKSALQGMANTWIDQQLAGKATLDQDTKNQISQYITDSVLSQNKNYYDESKVVQMFKDHAKPVGDNRNISEQQIGQAGRNLTGLVFQAIDNPPKETQPNNDTEQNAQIKQIQDLITARQGKATAEGQVDSFLGGLPGELAKKTSDFMASETQGATKTLAETLAPAALASLNSRGQLGDVQGGSLPYELAQTAGTVQSSLEQEQADLMAQDDQFFQNLSYQNTLRKLVESGGDVTGEIQYEKAQATQTQKQGFSASMTAKTNALNLELAKRNQEIQTAKQQEEIRRQADQNQGNQMASLYGQIGSSLVAGGTAGLLSKLGSK